VVRFEAVQKHRHHLRLPHWHRAPVHRAQRALTDETQKKSRQAIPWVFHRNGEPIRDFRAAWKTARGRLSALRDRRRAGSPRGRAQARDVRTRPRDRVGKVLGQMAAASGWLGPQLCDTSPSESGENWQTRWT